MNLLHSSCKRMNFAQPMSKWEYSLLITLLLLFVLYPPMKIYLRIIFVFIHSRKSQDCGMNGSIFFHFSRVILNRKRKRVIHEKSIYLLLEKRLEIILIPHEYSYICLGTPTRENILSLSISFYICLQLWNSVIRCHNSYHHFIVPTSFIIKWHLKHYSFIFSLSLSHRRKYFSAGGINSKYWISINFLILYDWISETSIISIWVIDVISFYSHYKYSFWCSSDKLYKKREINKLHWGSLFSSINPNKFEEKYGGLSLTSLTLIWIYPYNLIILHHSLFTCTSAYPISPFPSKSIALTIIIHVGNPFGGSLSTLFIIHISPTITFQLHLFWLKCIEFLRCLIF